MTSSPFNLFSSSSQGKKPIPSVKPKSKPVAAPPKPVLKSSAKVDNDVLDMIDKMKGIHKDIESKLEEVFQKTGLNAKIVKEYLDNPNNFPTFDWNRIQEDRLTLMTKICEDLGLNVIKVTEKRIQKETAQASKERKNKLLGGRKNWISMR